MLSTAKVRYLRITPRKMSYVIAPLRRRTVAEALTLLASVNRRAAGPLAKLIASAFANARQANPVLREDEVIISKCIANEGPTWKRFKPAAFGRAAPLLKRTSHVTVELEKK